MMATKPTSEAAPRKRGRPSKKIGVQSSCFVLLDSSQLRAFTLPKGELEGAKLEGKVQVTLDGVSDKSWEVKFDGGSAANEAAWKKFVKDNQLSDGDLVQLTFIPGSKLIVSIVGRRLTTDEGEKLNAGEELVGQRVLKEFVVTHPRLYDGRVEKWNQKTRLFFVRYADGDCEEYTLAELRRILVIARNPRPTEPAAASTKRPLESSEPVKPKAKGGKKQKQGSDPEPAAQDPDSMGKQAGGAGFERGARAFYVLRVEKSRNTELREMPVGPWIMEGSSVVHKFGGDKRYMPDRQVPEGMHDKLKFFVPGWLGVSTADSRDWNTAGRDDDYVPMIWDSEMAYRVRIPITGTVEESAKRYDQVALAYFGVEKADTNYPVDAAAREAASLPPSEQKGPNSIVTAALRLLVLECCMGLESVDPTVTSEEWASWREKIWSKYATRVPRPKFVSELAAELRWLMSKVKEDVIRPKWLGQPFQKFLQACSSCDKMGSKNDHYPEDKLQCFHCCTDGAKRQGAASAKHGMQTLHALLKCARDDILSQAAMDDLQKGGTGSEAARLDQEKFQAKISEGAKKLQGMDMTQDKRRASTGRRMSQIKWAPESISSPLRIIIIGAGVSGLKAAVELQRAGAEVMVLEGSGRVGGRVCTQIIGQGENSRPVDMGASFICGTDRTPPVNPIFEYAKDELKLKLMPKMRDGPNANVFYDRNLKEIPKADVDAAEEIYSSILDKLMEEGDRVDPNVSVQSVVSDLMSKMVMKPLHRDTVNSYMSDLYAATMDKISLKGAVAYGYDGYHELVSGGYKQVVDALVAGTIKKTGPKYPVKDIRLNHYVKKIEMLPEGVKCHVTTTKGSETLQADCALVTIPLGVLKKGDVKFEPDLPAFKKEAIAALDMGTENRCAMLFEKVFWPEHAHFLRPVSGRYTFSNLHALGVKGVLCAWIRPDAVPELESWSKEQVLQDVTSMLKAMFKDAFTPPIAFDVTYWASNKFSYGSYSFVPVGATKEDYDRLSWPISGNKQLDEKQAMSEGSEIGPELRVFFAGEATHKDDAYTVHGAYESGMREAARITRWWNTNHNSMLGTMLLPG